MLVIGITGTLGAGKGTVVKYLVERYGFTHHSVRDFIVQEVLRRQLPVNLETVPAIANDLRAENGPSFIMAELCRQANENKQNAVIESVRNIGEVDFLRKQEKFCLLAVDANPKTRYERIKLRKSALDTVSFEEFLVAENKQMSSTDPHHQNLSACIARADFVLNNDGTPEVLHGHIDEVMSKVLSEPEFELSPRNL